ncbi:MAG TPA: mannosyltransferase family protein [Candidatus Saccharimonadales bacterium]|nr:mannosyltransferase family protein [Candidatus Saccharimonadales bacterium]
MQNKQANLWRRINQDNFVWWAIGLVSVWRMLLEVVNQTAQVVINHKPIGLENIARWANWDGGWYFNINNVGYHHTPGPLTQENVAFFPGFPETIGLIARALHADYIIVGLALNLFVTALLVYAVMNLASLLAVRYGADKKRRTIALLSALTLLAFPSSYFLVAYYAEAMLVLGFVGAVYFALRGRYWATVPFLIVATASKSTGVIAVITVAIIALEQWWQDKNMTLLVKKWLITSLGVSGLFAFMTYLWVKFGDPVLFYHAQQAWGRNSPVFFGTRLIKDYYFHLFDPRHFGGMYGYALNVCWMLTPFVLLGVVIIAWRSYKAYWPIVLAGLAMALPLSTGIPDSLHRYALVAVPIVPFAVLWFSKYKPAILYVLLSVSGLAMLLFAAVFLAGNRFSG